MRLLISMFASALLVTGCAAPARDMYAPSEAEQRDCEARGGSIEPAYAIGAYVCLLPETTATPSAAP